jgi:plasmid stabilization system protein ParE
MAGYVLTPTAQGDLREIRSYLADAPEAIRERVIAELLATCQQAAQFPESGRVEAELPRQEGKVTRSLLCFPYRIFYYPETLPLQIFAVIHGRRDPIQVLKQSVRR